MSLGPAHVRRVQTLYRSSLKLCRNWAVDRAVFRKEADAIQAEFRAHMRERNPAVVESLVARGERALRERAHPDPYIMPEAPGGSKWERNTPPPPSFRFRAYPSETHAPADVLDRS